jgi:hypothetical protein
MDDLGLSGGAAGGGSCSVRSTVGSLLSLGAPPANSGGFSFCDGAPLTPISRQPSWSSRYPPGMTGAQLGAQPGPMATPPSAVSGADIDGSLLSLLSRVESARASATGAMLGVACGQLPRGAESTIGRCSGRSTEMRRTTSGTDEREGTGHGNEF